MNLKWMADKIKDYRYSSVRDYAADVDLIRANCRAFNGPAHELSALAGQLRQLCYEELADRGYPVATAPK